ncbi:MAG: glutamate-5-semialdehyde dehydrogenase, partial [Patescibacteria group bacterium]
LVVRAFSAAGVPQEAVQFIAVQDHAAVPVLAEMADQIDLIIPRGGQRLIDAVCASAKMPVLHHRKGVTHMYVDASANIDMATKIVVNGKISNPSVCNSLEKVLIDESIAQQAVPSIVAALQAKGVEVRGCEQTQKLAPGVVAAQAADWSTEYLDLIITMKVVAGMQGALEHLQHYSSGLADGIVTENYERAWEFVTSVDSAATYVNASTRFTDGAEFGLGAEVGISTAKIHGMGPMGLEDLTVTKYIVFGDGQIRE